MMNLAQRHQAILDRIHQNKHVSIIGLSNDLKVSSVTIRKDIRLLEAKNLVFRKHGRAFVKPDNGLPVQTKPQKLHSLEKGKMARAALTLLKEQDSVMIGAGSTLCYLAKYIPEDLSLTVVTSSLEVAIELIHFPRIDVVQLAGTLLRGSSAVSGAYAEQGLQGLNFSTLFLEVAGVDLVHGLTVGHAAEAHLIQQMISRSQKVVLIVESGKFGRINFSKVCEMEAVDHIITDKGVSQNIIERLRFSGVVVTVV